MFIMLLTFLEPNTFVAANNRTPRPRTNARIKETIYRKCFADLEVVDKCLLLKGLREKIFLNALPIFFQF